MLVVKSCVELLRSCGINNLVAGSDIPAFCLDFKLPSTSNIEIATDWFETNSRQKNSCMSWSIGNSNKVFSTSQLLLW